MDGEVVNVGGQYPAASPGTAGVNSQVPGQATTVSGVAGVTGGIAGGNLIEPDIDKELYQFKKNDTPLMQLMLSAKKVKVASPVVEHYMIDEPRASVVTTAALAKSTQQQAILPLASNEAAIPRPYGTLLAKGVDGYTEDGQNTTPGKELMLFVVGHDPASGNPIVRAVNGPKATKDDEYCTIPAIPEGTTLIILSNALYETQKEVDPDIIVPRATQVYLQKRGMNQIVSDYYDAVRKRIPFSKAIQAEAAITEFKIRSNRTLYCGRKGKFKVNTGKVGVQDIYTTEGVRYQVKKELEHAGRWTVEEIIALCKMAFTGEDVPKRMILLAGKNLLESIQCIDFKNHPEVQITKETNKLDWEVTNFHTVFGDIEIKYDPTLDYLGWANSGLLLAPDRVVHYQFRAENSSSERMEGEEATRTAILAWDALALKGSCHIWINGEGLGGSSASASIILYDGTEAPEAPKDGKIYYLINDVPDINAEAMAGTMWKYKDGEWTEYAGDIVALQSE